MVCSEGFFMPMKYSRLTREQFEELHPEFITFLATQSITKSEWDRIKSEQPHVAEQELDVFSDLIWEGVLGKTHYLENIVPNQMFLFHLAETEMHLLVVRTPAHIDVTTLEGVQWLQEHWSHDEVEIFKATKPFSDDKNKDIFQLIEQGAVISEGNLYRTFKALLN